MCLCYVKFIRPKGQLVLVRETIRPTLSVVDVVGKPIIYRRRDVLVVDIPVKEREDVSSPLHKYMCILCVYFY